jgi:hypothetical protein
MYLTRRFEPVFNQVVSDFWRAINGSVALFIRVTPCANKNEIAGLWRGPDGATRLAVKVTPGPDKGRPNDAVLKLLAKSLDMPKSAFAVASGAASRLKTVEITGAPETLNARLSELSETFQSET